MRSLNSELGTTVVIVTHDPLVSEQVQRTVAIRDGRKTGKMVAERLNSPKYRRQNSQSMSRVS